MREDSAFRQLNFRSGDGGQGFGRFFPTSLKDLWEKFEVFELTDDEQKAYTMANNFVDILLFTRQSKEHIDFTLFVQLVTAAIIRACFKESKFNFLNMPHIFTKLFTSVVSAYFPNLKRTTNNFPA